MSTSRLRTIMIVVAIVALGLGAEIARERWTTLRNRYISRSLRHEQQADQAADYAEREEQKLSVPDDVRARMRTGGTPRTRTSSVGTRPTTGSFPASTERPPTIPGRGFRPTRLRQATSLSILTP